VNLVETLIIHDLDAGTTATVGPSIFKGTENTYVEWTIGSNIKTVAEWKADWALTPSAMNGPFWILDTDGWFYWAEPLNHGDSTSTILESVELLRLADYEELVYTIDVNMEAIDHGLRDFAKWRDPMETDYPTLGLGIRPLFGLTDFGVDSTGADIASPIQPMKNGNSVPATTLFLEGITLYAAGPGTSGQISEGTGVDRTSPVQMMWDPVTPMTQRNVKDMKRGWAFSYIQKPDGTWWGVGYNSSGQLSNGGFTNTFYPVPMMWDSSTAMDSTNVKDIKLGAHAAFFLRDDGGWYGVGVNSNGMLSDGTFTNRAYPVAMEWSEGVPILQADIANFVAGLQNAYLLKRADNTWYGVGANNSGQLSIGATGNKSYPVQMKWDVSTAIGSTDVIVGGSDGVTYLRKASGTYWAVGLNNHNHLSDGTVTNRLYPVQMLWDVGEEMTTANVQQFVFGSFVLYVLKSDDVWYAQGANTLGQLARGAIEATGAVDRYPQPAMWDDSNPVTKANTQEVRVITDFAQLQKPDGSWWAVGGNAKGTLVDGTLIDQYYPVPMLWADGTMIGAPPGTFPDDGG
jgi:alpha-tubulin suppressor-like RCC1 family protein